MQTPVCRREEPRCQRRVERRPGWVREVSWADYMVRGSGRVAYGKEVVDVDCDFGFGGVLGGDGGAGAFVARRSSWHDGGADCDNIKNGNTAEMFCLLAHQIGEAGVDSDGGDACEIRTLDAEFTPRRVQFQPLWGSFMRVCTMGLGCPTGLT